MHQTMEITTIPAPTPIGIQIFLDVFWKLNINRETKNPQTLFKRISTIQRVYDDIANITYDHISKA